MDPMLAREKWQIETIRVLEEVFAERCRQVSRYGLNRNLYDGTGPNVQWLPIDNPDTAEGIEQSFRVDYEEWEDTVGPPTWLHLVREEVAEAFKEDDPVALEAELLQLAALCVSWVERLHERGARPLP